ncbi:ribosome small subunit-dependent GTPase A [Rothia kristinae]|uniref:GTPase n=1 Tax=Rothia kristinae TaxID=37923 RepID=A0A147E796_9MICC|nr:GTPase RsgA [Rothia kristinae]TDP56787.1 ribosome biogenesis GTPase [Kocuria sp. AG109]KTR37755.1 GTPase [Rothia kristinae]KTR60158.1 GTPase [Rothia kristinae]KTR74511.1 GTPase [Rothia kristinae]KTR78909.1 GTPase [Rothia kristinae]
MSRGIRGWDESDVRVRANKRGSRPRTKERPAHEDAVIGRVVTVDRGRYTARIGEGSTAREVTAVRAKDLRRTPVVTGDLVGLVGDVTGDPGSLARLVRVQPRETVLRRSADDTDPVERVVVANAQILVIVTAAADPQPRTGFVDRSIVAAVHAGLRPVLCVTKTDLADPAPLLSYYAGTDLPILLSRRDEAPEAAPETPAAPAKATDDAAAIDEAQTRSLPLDGRLLADLRALLDGRVSVLLGHSGVGKSTLVNALTGARRSTGGVNAVTGRGRHTSSSALALQPAWGEPGTWIIDTPGIRSFGLAHVPAEGIVAAFEDLAPGAAACPKGCTHAADAIGCGIAERVASRAAGPAGAARLDSLRRLLGVEAPDGVAGTKRLGAGADEDPVR